MEMSTETRAERRRLLDVLAKAEEEIHKEILGQDELIQSVKYCLIAPMRRGGSQFGGNLLIEGSHGLGKTLLVKVLGRVLNLKSSRIQFTVDVDPASITGSSVLNPTTKEFDYKPGAIHANIVLGDEISRTNPKVQSSLFEAMEEQTVTLDGRTYQLPRPFYLFATTNIAEEVGTVLYKLPIGQRDRFFMSCRIKHLELELERRLFSRPAPLLRTGVEGTSWQDVESVQAESVLDGSVLESISLFIARHYPISESSAINDYITRLVRRTRLEHSVLYGASSRAGIDLARAAQTAAFLADDDLVTQSHVVEVFKRVLQLRIHLVQVHERDQPHDKRDIQEVLDDIIRLTPLFERNGR